MAYEHFIENFSKGVTDIDISQDGSVTVSFAATTDSEAWITVEADGAVKPSFGGTGISGTILDEYLELAVEIASTLQQADEKDLEYTVKKTIVPGSP
jgi:hypothetical protein